MPETRKPLTTSIVRSDLYSERQFSLATLRRSLVQSGVMENPDEILRQFGTYEGVAFYFRMIRQFAFLGKSIKRRIGRVLRIERQVVPGDTNSEISVRMADDARRVWQSVPNKETQLFKLLFAPFVGYAAAEKVWGRHEETGLIAPLELHDVPQPNVKFAPDWTPLILTENTWRGVPVEPRKLIIFRWGSTSSPYGEAELKDVYLPTWYMQIILDNGLQSLEQLGRPIPVVHIPKLWDQDDVDEYEDHLAAQFKFYVTVPTEASDAKVEFPGMGAAAGGNAGRAEQEFLRYLQSWIEENLEGTAQTGDRGGSGNGKLEEVRSDERDDKTAPVSDGLDAVIEQDFFNDIGEVNWRDQPKQLWPKVKSDTSSIEPAGMTGIQMANQSLLMLRLVAKQLPQAAVEELLSFGGIPHSRAARIVESIMNERDDLTVSAAVGAASGSSVAPTEEVSE